MDYIFQDETTSVRKGINQIMKKQKLGGSMVFIASKNGLAASAGASAYCAAKAAEIHLARCLALEGAPFGIRVNTINPDAVLRGSKIWQGEWRQQRAESNKIGEDDLEEFYRNRSLLKRSVFPEDIAEAAFFLAACGLFLFGSPERFRRVAVVHAFQLQKRKAVIAPAFFDAARNILPALLQKYVFQPCISAHILGHRAQLHLAADALRAHDLADLQVFLLHVRSSSCHIWGEYTTCRALLRGMLMRFPLALPNAACLLRESRQKRASHCVRLPP